MQFLIFFVIALFSLFGFGQMIGVRNQESNFIRRVYDRFNRKKSETLKEKLDHLRHPEKKSFLSKFFYRKRKLSWFERVVLRKKD